MFDGRDLDEAERLVGEWQAGIEERASHARALAQRLSAITATAGSDGGLVSVTIDSSGHLTDLVLREGIRDQPAAATARAILATVRSARESLTAAVRTITNETVGAESETGRAVITAYQRAGREGPADA